LFAANVKQKLSLNAAIMFFIMQELIKRSLTFQILISMAINAHTVYTNNKSPNTLWSTTLTKRMITTGI